MSVILLTACSPEYQPLANIVIPNKEEYCERHGYSMIQKRHPLNFTCWDRPRLWCDTLLAAKPGDWLFWQGMDTIVTNLAVKAPCDTRHGYDLIISADGNGLQSDVFMIRRTIRSLRFLEDVIHLQNLESNEQEAMSVILSNASSYANFKTKLGPLAKDLVTNGSSCSPAMIARLNQVFNMTRLQVCVVPQRVMNAYPYDQYGLDPNHPDAWRKWDYILHLPGKSLEERLAVFPKYLDLAVR